MLDPNEGATSGDARIEDAVPEWARQGSVARSAAAPSAPGSAIEDARPVFVSLGAVPRLAPAAASAVLESVIEDARPDAVWSTAVPSAAPAARSRPRGFAVGGFGAAAALVVIGAVVAVQHQSSVHGIGSGRQPVAAASRVQIPRDMMLVGNTPAGYRPVPGTISAGAPGPAQFMATYTCVSNCPPDPSPGRAPWIMFDVAQPSEDGLSGYNAFCGPQHSQQGYVCTDLGPEMWRAAVPDSTVFQLIIYERGDIEFTLQAPPTMDPGALRAYMLSIHPASDAELVSLLRGYPNYS